MSLKYWGSPFPVVTSLSEALSDAGIEYQPWRIVHSIKPSELLILFDPPDLVLSLRANNNTTTNQCDLDLIELSILYCDILEHANHQSIRVIAAWQLLTMSQSLSLREILINYSGDLSSLKLTSNHYPEVDIIPNLGAQYLDQKMNGSLFSLYCQVDGIATRFGRDSDTTYQDRLEQKLDHHAIARALKRTVNSQQRESFLLNGLHQTQQEFRDYVLESKEIMNQYQLLLNESQATASKYRDDLAKHDSNISQP